MGASSSSLMDGNTFFEKDGLRTSSDCLEKFNLYWLLFSEGVQKDIQRRSHIT